jgi:hypothetical protein
MELIESGRTNDAGRQLWLMAPSRADEPGFIDWWIRYARFGSAAGGLEANMAAMMQWDLDMPERIPAPVLVLHRRDIALLRSANARAPADRLPNAIFVELPGADSLFFSGDVDCAWKELLDRHHTTVRSHLARLGREIDTPGDGFLATFDSSLRAIEAARRTCSAVRSLGLEVRAGVYVGEIELVEGDVGGIAVHIGARVAALAGPGAVLVSSTVKDLGAGSGIEFEDRSTHELKGVPGEWRLFAVKP